ncbi:MAG: hypothetical protein IJV41_10860 [Oscillospiraceae bacterium]|nr:hypothetical protein [Oscillospiraceae bacterium]
MIEAYVPHRSDPTDRTATSAPSTAEKLPHAPAMENLVETRKKQYEIVQQLGAMLGAISGKPVDEEVAQEWRGLVELTEQIADANDAIARLVKDCRELIGA